MPEIRSHRRSRLGARLPALGGVVVLLVAGGIADGVTGSPGTRAVSLVQPVPVAAPPGSLSSSWFCAGATDEVGAPAPANLVIDNNGPSPAQALVTMAPSAAKGLSRTVAVPAGGQAELPEAVPGGSPWIGAIVDVDAGGVAVFQEVTSPMGPSTSPCATSGSATWYFATGATLVNASEDLSLLNPYPTLAVVDLSFTTNEGLEAPEDFQGIVVPAGGLTVVDLGAHLRRRPSIAVSVTATSGRVVAWKTDVVSPPEPGAAIIGTPAATKPLADPASPIPGVTVTLGAPSAATSWVWPDGLDGNGVEETYLVYNPEQQSANLSLAVHLDQGTLEPFQLALGPLEVATISSAGEVRMPSGVGHSAVLESTNGVPVVAERTVSASGAAPWSGLGELLGGRLAARRWLLAAAPARQRLEVVVYNPGPASLSVNMGSVGGVATVPSLVEPGGRATLSLSRAVPGKPLVVSASAPVYVEADVFGDPGSPGVGLSFAVPLS